MTQTSPLTSWQCNSQNLPSITFIFISKPHRVQILFTSPWWSGEVHLAGKRVLSNACLGGQLHARLIFEAKVERLRLRKEGRGREGGRKRLCLEFPPPPPPYLLTLSPTQWMSRKCKLCSTDIVHRTLWINNLHLFGPIGVIVATNT